MMRNINKIIALALLLFLFTGMYLFSINYDPNQYQEESDDISGNVMDREFEEMFETSENKIPKENTVEYRLETFELEKGWGYKIYMNQEIVIDQKHIPAIIGIVAFLNKEQAETAGEFVMNKIREGIFPPTITINELDSLGIIY